MRFGRGRVDQDRSRAGGATGLRAQRYRVATLRATAPASVARGLPSLLTTTSSVPSELLPPLHDDHYLTSLRHAQCLTQWRHSSAVVHDSPTDSGWRAMTPRRTTVEHSRGVFNVEWPLFGELSRALAL